MSQQQSIEQPSIERQSMGPQASPAPNGHGQGQAAGPDPVVVPPARRRRFSAGYKRRILDEADRCTAPGEVGALLRREGLYSSHLTRWRAERQQGWLDGRPTQRPAAEVARLQQENERLKRQLERAELIIEAQKKLCQLFNLPPYPQDGPK